MFAYTIKVPINGFNVYRVKATTEGEAMDAFARGELEFMDTQVTKEGDPETPVPCECEICEEKLAA
jgi:hypothetical protein